MSILILGSVALPVPPPAQGGTEWIAYYQAVGLAEKGHQSILVGGKGSARNISHPRIEVVEIGNGDVVSGSKNEQQLDAAKTEGSRKLRLEMVYLSQVAKLLLDRKDDYDVILNNMRGEAIFLPIAKLLNKPLFTVMHLPIFPELARLLQTYKTHVIPISNNQKKDFPGLSYTETIYNGVDTETFSFSEKGGEYLLMVGSIGEHKNQKDAITVAKQTGSRLILAGKIRDADYFAALQKDIDGKQITWVGEVGLAEKIKLYQGAKALLFPIVWEEPFGLVMIEAMSCGTPVIAYKHGATGEVIVDKKTGFLVDTKEEMCMVVKKLATLKREDCRVHVVDNFSVQKMIDRYERVLRTIN